MCRNILITSECALLNACSVYNYQPIDVFTAGRNEGKESRGNMLARNKTEFTINAPITQNDLLLANAV